ncbi:hypothetical protein [Ramlibacter sp. AN1133]|uniref:hypothetical protein n=1 Tax=Ramlibacter sp. AN1133 TaxID=3133429 RepID=UPI0030BA6BE3
MTLKTLVLVLALGAGSAGAQTVWRCGNSYSQQPCAGGTPVSVSEPVTGRAMAMPVANTDAKLAAEMEKSRLAQERNAPKAIVIGPVEAPPLPGSGKEKDGTKPKVGKLEQFTAVSPGHPKEKKAKANKKKKAD